MRLPAVVGRVGKRVVNATPILRRHILSSTDYCVLSGSEQARGITATSSGWLATRTVMRQERAYSRLLAAMRRGEPRLDLTVAAEAVAATGIANPAVLDVGCGSGYYSDIFATLLPGATQYSGVDYSDAMIARARDRYPLTTFVVADGANLPYADSAFDVVFNGVSLMHIIDYQATIREAGRVAAHYCIFHSVPVFDNYRTTFLRKYAYGAPVVEIIFGKPELMSLCRDAGLRLVRKWASIPYDVSGITGKHSATETYLFSVANN
jgi:SAM-dependent methyltransferase